MASSLICGAALFGAEVLRDAGFLRGDLDALRELLEYNVNDVVNLQRLMQHAYKELTQRIGAQCAGYGARGEDALRRARNPRPNVHSGRR